MKTPAPLVFDPVLKAKPWGGERLADLYPDAAGPAGDLVGEAWLFGDLPEGTTLVRGGPCKGASPRELLSEYGGDLAGPFAGDFLENGLPLLFKLIDARLRLSVQVHPDDDDARLLEGEPRGKSEAWYVLEAGRDSRLYMGLSGDADTGTLLENLASSDAASAERLLNGVPAVPGRIYPVPAGTLHAIGDDILLAELQQSSNTTYRLYDWNRPGLDGRPRELHLDKGRRCLSERPWHGFDDCPPSWSDDGGYAELLACCQAFVFERIRLTGRLELPLENESFSLLVPLSSPAGLLTGGRLHELPPYHACLLPASFERVTLVPVADAGATGQELLHCYPVRSTGEVDCWRGVTDRDSILKRCF